MIEANLLEVLDVYEWLGSGRAAGDYLYCNQSTVVRKLRAANSLFQTLKSNDADRLLELEREAYQHWRFASQCQLRVHLYSWTNVAIASHLDSHWRLNPSEISVPKRPAIELLHARVIDALCAPYPVVAGDAMSDLALYPLYSTPLRLLADTNSTLHRESNLSDLDIALGSSLSSLSFVPTKASSCSEALDASLFPASAADPNGPTRMPRRYYGTALTPLVSPTLAILDYKPIYQYQEMLVVLREWKDHPCTLHLLEQLSKALCGSTVLSPLSHEIQIAGHA